MVLFSSAVRAEDGITTAPNAASAPWAVGLRPSGGGFYLAAPDHKFHLNLLGYGQLMGSAYSSEYHEGNGRTDYPFGFVMRRARFAMLATLHDNTEFYLEMGTPTIRNLGPDAMPQGFVAPVPVPGAVVFPAMPTPSFGLVEARITTSLSDEAFQLRVGKFISPISAEGSRNPKYLESIERYSVLNSLHGAGYLDTQIGAMLFGRIVNGAINYYLGAWNGNSNASSINDDENGSKDFQAKFAFQPHSSVVFGFGFDTGLSERPRKLSLLDHAYVPRVTGDTGGTHYMGEFDFYWGNDTTSVRLEFLHAWFPDTAAPGVRRIWGGYVQPAVFLSGNDKRGIQLLTRYEYAQTELDQSYSLHSGILGLNFIVNDNFKFSPNYIAEVADGPSSTTGSYTTTRLRHIAMMMFQGRF